jgi:hypothetical protein
MAIARAITPAASAQVEVLGHTLGPASYVRVWVLMQLQSVSNMSPYPNPKVEPSVRRLKGCDRYHRLPY